MQKHKASDSESQGPTSDSQPRLGDEGPLFGARLRELRIARGLTQPDLAAHVGTSASNISDLERGVKVPTLTTVARLADALDCNVSEMVDVLDRKPRRRKAARKG
jgi:transcriptional regulator with XRE-family HTH domain